MRDQKRSRTILAPRSRARKKKRGCKPKITTPESACPAPKFEAMDGYPLSNTRQQLSLNQAETPRNPIDQAN